MKPVFIIEIPLIATTLVHYLPEVLSFYRDHKVLKPGLNFYNTLTLK